VRERGRPLRESWLESLDVPGRQVGCGACDAAGADCMSGETTILEFEVGLQERGILVPTSHKPTVDVRGTPARGRPSPVTRLG